MQNVKRTQVLGLKELCSLRKPLIHEADKKRNTFTKEPKDWTDKGHVV